MKFLNKIDDASQLTTDSSNRFVTDAEKTKLAGIATNATKNDTDANLKSRANHTGTQLASTISDFANTVRDTALTGLSTATNAVITATDTVLSALGKLQKQISDNLSTLTGHTGSTSNPHSVTKSQVGLGSVDNIQQATKTEFNTHNTDNTRHITSAERTSWNSKVDSVAGKGLSTEDYTSAEKTKLSGIETGANKYTHPSTHPYTMITGAPTSLPANGGNADTVDGYHLNQDVGTTASPTFSNTTVGRYYQSGNGIPSSNLGNPSVTEMAIIDAQFTNKLWFYNPSMFTFEYTNDGSTWITQNISELDIKRFVSGNSNASIHIPRDCIEYRITIKNNGAYVYLNALYMYFSTSGNSTKVQMYKKRNDEENWTRHTSATNNVSSWPGHLYLPFSTIAWSQGSTAGHYNEIRVVFTPNWGANSNHIYLQGLEIWGGYPSGRRTIYSHDENQVVTFPSDLKARKFITSSGIEVSYDGHIHDDRYYTETEVNTLLGGKVDNSRVLTNVPANAKFTDTVYTHPGSGTNPHGTTKADVGLGSVLNYGTSTEAEAQTGTSNAKYMTPLRTKQAIDNTNTIHVGSSAPSSTKIGWVDTSL